jgi:hypothetical protein
MNRAAKIAIGIVSLVSFVALAACSSSGPPRVTYSVGVGVGGYYGASPWRRYPRHPVYVGGGGGINLPDRPVAAPLPDFGMPDIGPSADFADFDF